MAITEFGPISWERMIGAVEDVQKRLERAVGALEKAGIEYAVIGGNAVAAWVGKVDRAAMRITADVDLLIRREDLEQAKIALEATGFIYRHAAGVSMFLDGPDGKFRNAVHIIFANEKIKPEYVVPAPAVTERQQDEKYDIINLHALVQMKLASYRIKDRMHLLDMIDVGLIDQSWVETFHPELAERLQKLIDDPDA